MNKNHPLICIVGPTACGKTAVATRLAAMTDGEIISADSRQVYRGMDIGTGKDLSDYHFTSTDNKGVVTEHTIPYHLIDIIDAGVHYNLFEFQRDFDHAFRDILSRGKTPILCGGTGLYVESVIKGYDITPVPVNPTLRSELSHKSLSELQAVLRDMGVTTHNKIDTCQRAIRSIEIAIHKDNIENQATEIIPSKSAPTDQTEATAPPSVVFGIDVNRETRRRRISERLTARLQTGLVEEVETLLSKGVQAEDLIYYGLEYKYVTLYLLGQLSFDQMREKLEIAIHQFAKRQMTWLRGMERRGTKICWIDGTSDPERMAHEIFCYICEKPK